MLQLDTIHQLCSAVRTLFMFGIKLTQINCVCKQTNTDAADRGEAGGWVITWCAGYCSLNVSLMFPRF